jgi:hypothetical protein
MAREVRVSIHTQADNKFPWKANRDRPRLVRATDMQDIEISTNRHATPVDGYHDEYTCRTPKGCVPSVLLEIDRFIELIPLEGFLLLQLHKP